MSAAPSAPSVPAVPQTSSPGSHQQAIIDEFRANGGRVGGPFEGAELLLLTTTGAKSGVERTVPLGCFRADTEGADGGRSAEDGRSTDGPLLVVASNLGASRHPAWYHNLLTHPLVRVETAGGTFEAVAVPAEGDRRDRLFAQLVRIAPGYGEYQLQTSRILPVVALEPTGPEEEPDGADGPGGGLTDKLLEVHTWLRAQLAHVRAEADAHLAARAASTAAPGPGPGLGMQIRQHCLAFCESLTVHHTSEDAHLFPALASRHPQLRDTLARLADEHRAVARIKDELLALLDDIDTADPHRFRTELDRMTAELHAHLRYEEEELLPVLAGI